LVKYEGNFYYVGGNGAVIKDKSYYISTLNDLTYDDGTPVVKGTYVFDAEGKMQIFNGIVEGFYYVNNVKTPYAGLVQQDGYYYYVGDHGAVIKDQVYFITNTNDLTYEDGTPIASGNYEFDAEGKMKLYEGLVNGYYYVCNVITPYAGLIKHEGDFYYIGDHAQPIKNKSYYITNLNDQTYEDGTPIKKGTYTFDAEGKMQIYNGVVDGYYYVNNVKTPYAGLVKQDGDFYYVGGNGAVIKDKNYYISNLNDQTYEDGTPVKKGTYTFDAEGKMQVNNGLVNGYYYENNARVNYAGLIKQDGYYYYIGGNAQPIKNKTYFISNTNGLTWDDGTPIAKGNYTFDAEGRMVI